MIALVTGASSGMGREMAKCLAERGFDLVITARRRQRLTELRHELMKKYGVRVKILCHDLAVPEECFALYDEVKKAKIDVLINNAGFGVFGKFTETDLERELRMIDVNIKAVHILTKLFLKDFIQRGRGYILNTASLAGFMAGPFFSSYYASKNYVVQLTKAIYEELRRDKSNVYIGAFCPGPVNTEFNETAGADFAVGGMDEAFAARYAIDRMFEGQTIILPGILPKIAAAASKYMPSPLLLYATGTLQSIRKVHEDAPFDGQRNPDGNAMKLSEEELDKISDELRDINGNNN